MNLVEIPLKDGGSIVIESVEPVKQQGGMVPAGSGNRAVAKAEETFQAMLEKIKPAASAVVDMFSSLKSNEVDVEFGLKFSANGNAFIVSCGTEYNFKVTLKWTNLKS